MATAASPDQVCELPFTPRRGHDFDTFIAPWVSNCELSCPEADRPASGDQDPILGIWGMVFSAVWFVSLSLLFRGGAMRGFGTGMLVGVMFVLQDAAFIFGYVILRRSALAARFSTARDEDNYW